MKKQIKYINGDATNPIEKGVKIIAHICNDKGGWGKGFVVAISNKWKQPETEYRKWHAQNENNDFKLGETQLVQVKNDLYIANMIGQHGIHINSKGVPIRYNAVASCLEKLNQMANELNASVHMPRIGCGLAGGK